MPFLNYSVNLPPDLKAVYSSKLIRFGLDDPYKLDPSDCSTEMEDWPQIEHGDIVQYLVFGTHAVTLQQMKAYKSLEAHNYFTSGWVNNRVLSKVLPNDRVIMLGEVKHSQSMRLPSLKVWILSKKMGEILTAHCNCMAGMGDSCSHVGALLFYLESGNRLHGTSCTDVINQWLPPCIKEVGPSEIRCLDFSSAEAKRKRGTDDLKRKKKRELAGVEASEEEIKGLLKRINDAGLSAPILAVTDPYNETMSNCGIVVLNTLYSSSNESMTWNQLIDKCKSTFTQISISSAMAASIENKTKSQEKCKKWFTYRIGRITSSIMKSVCCTSLNEPAKGLLKNICYGQDAFNSAATAWGKENERKALDKYVFTSENKHRNLKIKLNGLFISLENPFIGASPDGIVSCDCCSVGVLEIKCPYINRNKTIPELIMEKNSFLLCDDAGNITLDRHHQYYFQVQTHLLASSATYCDFIVWTQKDMFIERILPDEIFTEEIVEKSRLFFMFCILPELTARWFSRH